MRSLSMKNEHGRHEKMDFSPLSQEQRLLAFYGSNFQTA
jgi:hypothetical protein